MADAKLIDMITDLVKAVQEENREQNKIITGLSVQMAKLESFRENQVDNLGKIFKKFIRINSEIKDIKNKMPNEREVLRAEKDQDTIEKKVSENSTSLLKISLYVSGFVAAVGFIIGVLKWFDKI